MWTTHVRDRGGGGARRLRVTMDEVTINEVCMVRKSERVGIPIHRRTVLY